MVPSNVVFTSPPDTLASLLRSIILVANSFPVSFSMHRLTVELIPLDLTMYIYY